MKKFNLIEILTVGLRGFYPLLLHASACRVRKEQRQTVAEDALYAKEDKIQ